MVFISKISIAMHVADPILNVQFIFLPDLCVKI